jgi:phospholipid transport system substrate-binding protein
MLAVLALVVGATAVGAAAGEPDAVVRELNAGLLDVMKEAEQLGWSGRYERVGPVVDASFDVPFMAEKSLGRQWKTLAEEERMNWVALFREFMISNYAGRFDRYSGQSFEERGKEDGAYDTVIVNTRLLNPDDEDVDLNYRLHETDQGWRVVDVYLKGTVSELALRRSDYTAVMKRDGFDALSGHLRAKIEALKTGTAE